MTDARQKGCCKMICFTAALFAFSKPIRFAGYEPAEKVSAFFIGIIFCQDLLPSDLRFNTALKIKYLMLWLCIEQSASIVSASDNLPFEDKVIHDLDLEVLHHALDSLNEEEYHIIECLYLADSPMTERDLAKSMGKSQPYINRLKRKIFDKIRKVF